MSDLGKTVMLRSLYIALGLMTARWIFRRHLEPNVEVADVVARLRAAGGI